MGRKESVQKTNAMRELERAHIAFEVITYEVDENDLSGIHVSEQLGEDPGQGFKTLVTVAPSGDHVVCCIPVAEELDLKAAARAARQKSLSMMHVRDLLGTTGYIRGGCSPIGMKKLYTTVVDSSCLEEETIIFSAGKIGAQVELAPQKLLDLIGAKTASITHQ